MNSLTDSIGMRSGTLSHVGPSQILAYIKPQLDLVICYINLPQVLPNFDVADSR